jgi:Delta7-sterol 5-desaturase
MILPMNIDMVFATFGIFFYGYGVYLHSGHELPLISAHNPIINSSFQHYLHHARSSMNLPYHTGFYFKIWDQLFGSIYNDTCICAECEKKAGRRTKKQFEEIIKTKPDYSILLSPTFLFSTSDATK